MLRKPVLLLIAALLAAVTLGQAAVSAATDGKARYFNDDTRRTEFTIHSDPADPKYGQFAFTVAGLGTYTGGDKASIRQKANGGGVVVNFKGDVQFFPLSGASSVRSVNMNAQVGPVDGHATAVLIDRDGSNYQMVSQSPSGNPEAVAAKVGSSLKAQDWNALYNLVSPTYTAGMTSEAFAAFMSAQQAQVGRVTSFAILATPTVQFSEDGYWFSTVQTEVTYEKDGVSETDRFLDYYIFEGDQWKFWFSAPSQ